MKTALGVLLCLIAVPVVQAQLVWTGEVIAEDFHPHTVLAVDVNDDGLPDVVGSAYWSDAVSSWLQTDDGWSFEPLASINQARTISAGYLTNDTHLDLIVSQGDDNYGGGGIYLIRNLDLGDGPVYVGSILNPYDVVAVDLVLDPRNEIVASGEADILYWRLGGGGWTRYDLMQDFGTYDDEVHIAAADFDNDGDTDIAASSRDLGFVRWLSRDPDTDTWSFRTIWRDFPGVVDLTAADVDGDGDVDLVACVRDSGLVVWWKNRLDPPGIERPWPMEVISDSQPGPEVVKVADIDADGDNDVVVGSRSEVELAWYQQQNPGPWVRYDITSDFGDGGYTLDLADMDLDGDIDVVAGSVDSDQIAVFRQSGQPAWPDLTLYPPQDPVVIPASGGNFLYGLGIANPGGFHMPAQLWSQVRLPDQTLFGPLRLVDLNLAGEDLLPEGALNRHVPAFAPPGNYTYIVRMGFYPTVVLDSDSLGFVKLDGARSASTSRIR